jgi:hypothetical protein
MNNEEINILISLEKIHRYVFDNLYVQTYTDYTDDEKELIDSYKSLCEQYPNFRQLCADAYIKLSESTESDDKLLFNELSKINFNRYSINVECKKKINLIIQETKKYE